MHQLKLKPMYVAFVIIWTLVTYATVVHGETTFYVQREGSPDDQGFTLFTNDAGNPSEQDFEDPELGPLYGEVPGLSFGELEMALVADWYGPNPPLLIQSSEFDQEGKVFRRALFPGYGLTVTPIDDAVIQVFGCWVFDDGGSLDSAYRLDVVETDGATSHCILENEIELDHRGHELEGFLGVISDVGILSLTITPIDPETQAQISDVFEVDHWMVTLFQPPEDECAVCGDLDDDGDVDIDDYWIILTSFRRPSDDALLNPCADFDGDGIVSLDDYAQFRECYLEVNEALPSFQDLCRRYGREVHQGSLRRLHKRLLSTFDDWPPRKKHRPHWRKHPEEGRNASRARIHNRSWERPSHARHDEVD